MRKQLCSQLWLGACALAATGAFASSAHSQQFQNLGGIPALGLATEAAKFGDWDLDNDLDIVYANGGDSGNQQSKLLINSGVGSGSFTDVTSGQFWKASLTPVMSQSSRDVQIVDIDNDGDLDFYMSNHSQSTTQSNTWFVNQGGIQNGTLGVYILDMSRWVGIGAAGSSIPAAQKITSGDFSGGFQDWSCQCDFADVDLDGDWDLLHTSYGPSFNASVMTRLFLNDSTGHFAEYNPSSAVSANPALASGSAAGFVEGTQLNDTTNTAGMAGGTHDITNMSLDADFSDLDGDFDNDVFANSRDTISRFWQNRFFENLETLGNEGAGTRLYRDRSGDWGANLQVSGSNYDADLNDMDNDNDTDGYFLNYSGTTNDEWLINLGGSGAFGGAHTVPNSGNDDNEIDWIDYDYDSDVDVMVSAFRGSDRFYKNQFVESAAINLVQVTITSGGGSQSLGADVGDVDNDGDPDMVFAEDSSVNEVLLKNTINLPDPIAPRVPHIFQLVASTTSSTPRRVVARTYDNSNQEHAIHSTGALRYAVNGDVHVVTSHYSGGNLFRGLIPGYWFGTITYSMEVTDRTGNMGTSVTKTVIIPNYVLATFGLGTPSCQGPMTLGVNSAPTINNPDFQMTCTGAPATTLQLCLASNSQGTGLDEFGIGLPIWADVFFATEVYGLDANSDFTGKMSTAAPIPNVPALIGANYFFQFITGDFSCGTPLATSKGGKITILN